MSAIPAIERTPEYEKFIADLKAFHERKGTLLQTEPILGGKKLDLLRIYKTVLEAGGYEQVTINRGWKQVGDPFNFPATCTNSAYILKAVYTKYLLGWEEETYWKRPWNPPPELLVNYQKASSPMPSMLNRNNTNRQIGTAFTQPSLRPAYQHQTQPQLGYQPAIFRDQEFRTRILLSLQSNLPNEIDWAFNTLVKFSYASENFSLDFMPTLIDLLLDFTKPFFKEHIDGENLRVDLFSSKTQQETYERVLQVFHIIRNFSFLEMNIRRLAMHERLFSLLIKSITTLSPGSQFGELSRHCLDILENIAPQVILTNREDPYLKTMTKLLFTNDRAFILGAIRALTRVAVTETNERILSFAEQNVVERMAQFLMIDDEELEAATLEYLYQYSSLRGNFSTQLLKCYPGNLIGLLTGFLSYKSTLAPPSSSAIHTLYSIPAAQLIKRTEPSIQEPPSIPDLTNYAYLDEPYRCLGWLKDQLMNGTEDDKILLKEIFNAYQKLFGTEKPLGMKEFYTVLKIAFPQPSIVEEFFSSSPAPLETVLQNVKYSPTRRRDGPICHWMDCNESFDNTIELHKHIIKHHLNQQSSCHWMKCTKPLKDKSHAIQHMRTHFAGKIKKQLPLKKTFIVPKIPVDDSEVSGIPLTSALLLRNLARYKQHHVFYLPYESELTLIAIQRPKVSKYILTVLNELKS
ncbi:uncharacterized protein BX663DRAFT_519331 [Cokeromyces recurvatus]|uniref:uncharacterized protein n=1 Tax=Cokeromyces recurvatus TaxID=90255 RepID=UPI00221EF366|nr:uncharacterized protein BX663DRAFT_519331 [Cokeromyces recurvatus]KAI7900019.1 hypothetical protein BX663DRAFT_519331 [Cokeromyces recurvatus]